MDTATCGHFKLALAFKLFAVGVSVTGPVLLLFDSSRTARHLFVRALPNSSIRIHCISSVAWDTRVEVEFLVEVKIFLQQIAYQLGHGSCPFFF